MKLNHFFISIIFLLKIFQYTESFGILKNNDIDYEYQKFLLKYKRKKIKSKNIIDNISNRFRKKKVNMNFVN